VLSSRPTTVRRALLALAVGGFGIGTGEFAALGVLPEIAHSNHVSIPSAGNVVSAYALGVVVGAPLLAAASVKLPRKGLLLALALAMVVGNLLSAAAPNFGTLLAARFIAGLPHGAYFGVASVVAAGLVPAERRSQAMAMVFAGLTVANIVGVPGTTLLAQHSDWRWVYVVVAAIQGLAALAIIVAVPRIELHKDAAQPHILHELRVFRKPQIWLTLAIPMIGGAGLFATFSYITPMMTHVAGYARGDITFLLVLFGIGMTAGNLLGARFADRALLPTICASLGLQIVISVIFFFAAHDRVTAAVMIVLFPLASLAALPAIQSRIVDLAGDAPNLAAASIQSAFNIANTIGAWAGGAAIAAGLGYDSPNLVAAGLSACGLSIALASALLDRRAVPVSAQ
jgi:MFS transporter, DHA1 family, inner membrane transport protein